MWQQGKPSDTWLVDIVDAWGATLSDTSTHLHGKWLSKGFDAALVEPVLRSSLPVCRQALQAASLAPSDLDAVLLAGGGARAVPLLALLAEELGHEPLRTARPEESAALVAALHAQKLQAQQFAG